MADESYRWLDLETAERLLRGESLEAVDEAARDQAERLAKTLDALTVEPAPTSDGLPGEEAALAAFRKVRAERADDWVSMPAQGRHRPATAAVDAGLVRIGAPDAGAGRPRGRRPAHLALAAVLAVGMAGGVVAAAGIGVLPHLGDGEPEPTASVSAAATPDRSLVPPSTPAPEAVPSPGGSPSGGGGSRDTARGDTGSAPDTGAEGRGARPRGDWNGAASACRDLRDGRKLDPTRRHSLEGAAGGSSRVWKYCKGVLSGAGTQGDPQSAPDSRKGDGKGEDAGDHEDGDKSGHGGRDGQDGRDGRNGRDDKNGHHGDRDGGRFTSPRKNHHAPDGGTSGAPLTTIRATMSPNPGPSPSYSAL
ncbi:hypothetical protein TUSST3_45710 [Streptomyces sp. TUS-ST3]|uniref:hypothetical protein n=1 Tax=Streptomyces sp. TUS-ST3 TaxID=3025591 RepID=UPI00235B4B74|nr:hypothetical protein [Streptomyces sp. TUS-ST3]GLP67949.1 hypothetical protein TUSST3_45710 [Streptomyces sp. TUS-ST3]